MSYGVMGGTFDPIHIGHLVVASEMADRGGLDRVIFVPAGEPWQKADRVQASARDRLEMVRIGIAGDPRFLVSTVDVDRAGPTYAVDTIADLKAAHPGIDRWSFIVGEDALAGLPSWRDVAELVSGVDFLVATRSDEPSVAAGAMPAGARITRLPTPRIDVSSTDIRERVRQSRPVRYLVPGGVHEYLVAHDLYGAAA